MHRAALAAAAIDGVYEARRVDAAGVHRACAELRAGLLHGANVTMPHKRLAASSCDELGDTARRGMTVNTLIARGGNVLGITTDVPAVDDVWRLRGLPTDAPVPVSYTHLTLPTN